MWRKRRKHRTVPVVDPVSESRDLNAQLGPLVERLNTYSDALRTEVDRMLAQTRTPRQRRPNGNGHNNT